MNPYQLNLPEHEKLVQCPYEKSHQILQSRLQIHLTKCKNSHGNKDLVVCCFNTTHMFPKSEIKAHEANCSDRLAMEQFMYDERPSSSYSQAAEALPNIEKTTGSKDNDEECWDDCNHKTYDPKLYVQNNYIIRNIQHGLKSERKKERQAEKARLDEIDRKNYEEENPRGNGFTTGGYTDQSFTSGANNPGKKRK